MNNIVQAAIQKISKLGIISLFSLTSFGTTLSLGSATLATTISPQTLSSLPRVSFVGLAPNNMIVRFGLRGANKPVKVTGVNGNLIGIDYRPANGKLYGLTDTSKLYIINPSTGIGKLVKTLTIPFSGGFQSGFDFNPQADRLRINSLRQNFAVNVDDGTATAQTLLAYANGDVNVGKDPNVTAAAYTNSVAGATSTKLYNIDYDLDVLVLQDPPNGTLITVGTLGSNFAPIAGFDIFTDSKGVDTAFAASGGFLYTVNLTKGNARRVLTLPLDTLIGLAVVPITGNQ